MVSLLQNFNQNFNLKNIAKKAKSKTWQKLRKIKIIFQFRLYNSVVIHQRNLYAKNQQPYTIIKWMVSQLQNFNQNFNLYDGLTDWRTQAKPIAPPISSVGD